MPTFPVGIPEGEMKRTRRVSIEFKHREVTIFVRTAIGNADEGEPVDEPAPVSCPTCGAAQFLKFEHALARRPQRRAALSLAMAKGEVHVALRGNELWLCQRSFEIFVETGQ
jgi:hypothetical protein